jgi:hypothetical protein
MSTIFIYFMNANKIIKPIKHFVIIVVFLKSFMAIICVMEKV